MGGYVKVSLRTEKEITTGIVYTDVLNTFLGNTNDLFDNVNLKNKIIENQVSENELFENDFNNREKLIPFNYGYIFIDRTNNNLFYINDYTPISYYFENEFKNPLFNKLKEQNFKIFNNHDIRKEPIHKDHFLNYFRLYNSLKNIKYIIFSYNDKKIDVNKFNFEELINNIFLNSEHPESFNSKFFIQWKNWTVYDESSNYESYNKLFNYLKKEKLLNDEEINSWKEILEEIKNN
tara:strand:+ start:35297 stop:36001 length:705 start_codon:yes stop_codon:yes gene_type:complete